MSQQLLSALRDTLGESYVLINSQHTQPYLIEQRGLFESTCLAVIKPANTQQVSKCVALCAKFNISIVPIGGNTGLCGGTVSQSNQILLSCERLNKIRNIDKDNLSIIVESGCILERIQQVAEEVDCYFPLSLGAQGSCQIGGNLSTNAGGINVLHYGNTRELCLGIEAVLPDGSIFSDLKGLRKDNTGYDLKQFFIGAEGTLGIICAATLKLFPPEKETITALIALDDLPAIITLYHQLSAACGQRMTTFELIPKIAIDITERHFQNQPNPFDTSYPWVILMVASSTCPDPTLVDKISESIEIAYEKNLIRDALIAQNVMQAKQFFALRENLVLAQKNEGACIKHDISVPISSIPTFIQRANETVQTCVLGARPYPFGHVGDGNIHYNILQPVGADPNQFMSNREAMHEAVLNVVHELGGSFSAEHGIGQLKTELIPKYKGLVTANLMRTVKQAIDPMNTMNPGKVVTNDNPS